MPSPVIVAGSNHSALDRYFSKTPFPFVVLGDTVSGLYILDVRIVIDIGIAGFHYKQAIDVIYILGVPTAIFIKLWDFLNDFLEKDLLKDTPDYDPATKYKRVFSACQVFTIEAQQWAGNPSALTGTSSLYNGYVFYGGIAHERLNQVEFLNDLQPTSHKFFTWADEMEVSPKSPVWLTWLMPDQTKNYNINVTAKDKDGNTFVWTAYTINGATAVNTTQMYHIRVDMRGLEFETHNPGLIWTEYTVRIQDTTGGNNSEDKKFYVDNDYKPNERHFFFWNSVGGFETFRCTGQQVTKKDFTSTESEATLESLNVALSYRIAGHNFPIENPLSRSSRRKVTTGGKINSGYHTEAELNQAEEMLLSPYVLFDDGTQLVPVKIVPGSFDFKEDGQDTFKITFEYKYVTSNSVRTP